MDEGVLSRVDMVVAIEPTGREVFETRIAGMLESAYRLAYAMLQDRAEAEDAVQEAAISAWRKYANLKDSSQMQPWFMGIVANRCRTIRRGRWFGILRSAEPRVETSPWSDPERGYDLRRALLKLPADDRLVLVLYYYLDLPLEAVAEISGLPLSTLKSRLYRAVRRMRPDMAIDDV